MTTEYIQPMRALGQQKLVELLEKKSKESAKLTSNLVLTGHIHSGRAQFQFVELFQDAVNDYRLDLLSIWTERINGLLPQFDAAQREEYIKSTLAAFDAGCDNIRLRLERALPKGSPANASQQLQPTCATRRQALEADLRLRLAEYPLPKSETRFAGDVKGASGHRLAAVVFIDIVDYTAQMAADEAATLMARDTLKATIDDAAKKHGGRVVKTMGDGFLLEFGSAVDAMSAAVDILTGNPLRLRIGLNVCEVVVDGLDILGDGVNLTQRLESQATPGRICLPAHVMDDLAGKLKLSPIDRGKVTLKNVSRPVHVVEVDPHAPPGRTARGLKWL